MKKLVLTTLSAAVLLGGSLGCTAETTTPETTDAPAEEALEAEAPAPEAAAEANLQTYNGPEFQFPVIARYPDTMQVEDGCAGEGCGFFFTFKPQGNALDEAEVHIFLPAGAATAAEQEPFVTGPNGLIENAGWTVNSIDAEGNADFPYPWVETVINFSTDQEQAGHILLGQTDGQAVQVVLLYPAEMAETYWQGARVVLDSLEFDPELLPLTRSEV